MRVVESAAVGQNSYVARLRISAALLCVLGVLCGPSFATAETMSLNGKLAVNRTGSAAYSIPIALPPATAGMSPALSLEYSSQTANGLLGMGWSLSGLPIIARCARTLVQDGVLGGVNYDGNDRFCMDGQRLVAVSGTYGADGTQYRTEIESFSKIISHGAAGSGPVWFEVHTKSGQTMEFGNTTDSRILAQGKTSARVWAVNKVGDTKTNYFSVAYTNDAANGQFYPTQINYTGNTATSTSPYNSVQFVYASRPDVIPQYLSGSVVRNTLRLANVKAYAGASLVTDYRLAYEQSGPSNRSRLTSVTACAGDGSCLPATTFGWTNVATGSFTGGQWSTSFGANQGWSPSNGTIRTLADVNSDGLPDVVGFTTTGVYVGINNGTSFNGAGGSQWTASFGNNQGWGNYNANPRMLVDVNGDGRPDVVGFASDGIYVGINTGTSFNGAGGSQWSTSFGNNQGWSDDSVNPRMFADVNGDGRPDVVGFAYDGIYVLLNTGTNFNGAGSGQWSASFGTNQGWVNNISYPRMVADMNGDGLPDVVGFAQDGVYVLLNTGTNFNGVGSGQWSVSFGANQGWADANKNPRTLIDMNGDGLPDVVGFAADGVYVALNTGTGLAPASRWVADYSTGQGWSDMNTYPRLIIDVNGDGLPDVVGFGYSVEVSLNNGASFNTGTYWSTTFGPPSGWTNNTDYPRSLVDAKGNGLPGIVGFAYDGVYVHTPNNGTGPIADLLRTVTDGLGATTTVTYVPGTNATVVTKGTGTAFPSMDLVAPIYVVSRVDTSNGVGGTYSAGYTYTGARFDVRGRGFLGFAQTTVNDLQTSVSDTTNYRQDFPYIGMVSSTVRKAGVYFLGQSANTFQFVNASGGTTISPSSAPYRVSLSQNVSSGNDLDGSPLPTVTTANQYDTYNNATQVTVSTSDGFSKTTVNTFNNDPTLWYLGRLTRATVTSVAP